MTALAASRLTAGEGQVSFPDNSRFAVQRLDEALGLEAVTVTAMGQDAQGFLWIATQTGLYRYDGARAKKMTAVEGIIGHYVTDLLIAPDGTPWFAGNHGIAHFHNGAFEALEIPQSAMPLATGNQLFAVNGKGVVYALLFKQGILRVEPGNPKATKVIGATEGAAENAAGIVRDTDDSIWFTFHDHLARIVDGADDVQVDPKITLPSERVVALLFDGTHTMWLRTATQLMRLDPRQHKVSVEKEVIGTANEEEGKPSVDRRGRLLVPSSAGLYWQQGELWKVVTDKQGISSNDIECALEDREGTLWVAGSGTGLDRLPGVHEWTAWTTTEGLPDNATWSTLRDHSGRLWVSTSRGIGIWNGKLHRWEKLPVKDNAHLEIRQIQLAGDGAVWALTARGSVVRIEPTTFQESTVAMFQGRVFVSILAAPDGSVWATTRSHIVRFGLGQGVQHPVEIPTPGDAGQVQFVTFSPKGVLWATGPGKLYRYDQHNWRMFSREDGLQGETISSVVALSDDEVWIAYNDVVSVTHAKLDASGAMHMEHHHWDWAILGHDSKNRIWFNGTDGITVLSPDGQLRQMSHADGLVWDDVSPWTGMREEADESFVIATSRGLARYQPSEVSGRQTAAANVMLTSVTLGGVERATNESPEVEASEGALAVQFTPMVFGDPGRVSCRYQLKGLEQQSAETQLREVRYGGLPAGNYEFWVQCQAPGSRTEPTRASFRFRVLPKLWQTWWAELSGVLLCAGTLWGFVFLRTRTDSRRRRELEQAVAQRNAELLQKNKELEDISLTDPLTMTRNRRYFYETIQTDVAQALRSHLKTADPNLPPVPKHELIFILADIDRFKRVNDELGHAAGDRLLQEMAKRIASVMRRSDDLVRWGGEEFMLVCRTTDRENASLLCERVLEAIRELPFDVGNGVQIHKTCSIGWAPFPWLPDDVSLLSIDNVIELADKGLYLAKREGRNRSFGMIPAADIKEREPHISMDKLRDCPGELVQIV